MHFHYLWALDPEGKPREEFWETALAVCGSRGIPEIGKLIGPGVAAESRLAVQEFVPLLLVLRTSMTVLACRQGMPWHTASARSLRSVVPSLRLPIFVAI